MSSKLYKEKQKNELFGGKRDWVKTRTAPESINLFTMADLH